MHSSMNNQLLHKSAHKSSLKHLKPKKLGYQWVVDVEDLH